MIVDISQISMKRDRSENQDCVGVFPTKKKDEGVFIVADGLGGHRGGALAAQAAVNAVAKLPFERRSGWIKSALAAANEAVVKKASENPETSSMRSTAVILQITGGKAYWAHAGDSRLYFMRKHKIIERTQDDSVVEVLRIMGEISEDEMGKHPDRAKLTKSLGEESELEFKAQIEGRILADGDRFILCTDGIWEHLNSSDLERISKMCNSSREFIDIISRRFSESGSGKEDNASLIVVTLKCVDIFDRFLYQIKRVFQ